MSEEKKQGNLAAIRIRGVMRIEHSVSKTLEMLRLYKKNCCVVLKNSPENLGMLKKVKDYVTYGIIDDETYKLLIEKRGEEYKGRETDSKKKIKYNKFIKVGDKKIKPYFRLNMPKGGFERKGIKYTFKQGGVLGDRSDKINLLIKKML